MNIKCTIFGHNIQEQFIEYGDERFTRQKCTRCGRHSKINSELMSGVVTYSGNKEIKKDI